LFVTAACHPASPAAKEKEKRPPLRYPYIYWGGYYPLMIAKEKGFFAEQGVDVELIFSADGFAIIPDFVAGKFDGVTYTMDVVLHALSKDPGIRVILAPGEPSGADVVMARPEITRISDLKGKKIAVEKSGSWAELLLGEMLKQDNLTLDDVTLITATETDIVTYLRDNTIQAGYTWDPYATQAAKGGAKKIFSSKQTPGLLPDFVMFRKTVLDERPKDVQRFIRAWFQAVDFWEAHPQEGNEIIAKGQGTPVSEVTREGYEYFSRAHNHKAFAARSGPGSLTALADRYLEFLVQDGQLERRPDVSAIFDSSYLPSDSTP